LWGDRPDEFGPDEPKTGTWRTGNLNASPSDYATHDLFLVTRSTNPVTAFDEETLQQVYASQQSGSRDRAASSGTEPPSPGMPSLRESTMSSARGSDSARRTTGFVSAEKVLGSRKAATWLANDEKMVIHSSPGAKNPATNVMNHDPATFWYGGKASTPQWIIFDLEMDHAIEQFQYWVRDEPNAPKDCELQAGIPKSGDSRKVDWKTAHTWKGTKKNGWEKVDIPFKGAVRHWRLVVKNTHAEYTFWGNIKEEHAVKIGEVKFFGAPRSGY